MGDQGPTPGIVTGGPENWRGHWIEGVTPGGGGLWRVKVLGEWHELTESELDTRAPGWRGFVCGRLRESGVIGALHSLVAARDRNYDLTTMEHERYWDRARAALAAWAGESISQATAPGSGDAMTERHYFAELEAQALIGRRVTTTREWPGVPGGTAGRVTRADPGDEGWSVAVTWELPGDPLRAEAGEWAWEPSPSLSGGHALIDWFSRDEYERWIVESGQDEAPEAIDDQPADGDDGDE